MKSKYKLMILILFIFLFLFLSSNVEAAFYDDYSYSDIVDINPFDTDFVVLKKDNFLYYVSIPSNHYFGYSSSDETYYMFDSTRTNTVKFNYSYTTDGKTFLNCPDVENISNGSYYTFFSGSTDLFPCYKNLILICDLPEDINWDMDIAIYCNPQSNVLDNVYYLFVPLQLEGSYFQTYKNYSSFGCVENLGDNFLPCNLYKYNIINLSWEFYISPANCRTEGSTWDTLTNMLYSSKDIYHQDSTLKFSNTNNYFSGLRFDNNNDYNYDDYVLPELPDNLYKYNYIVSATNPAGNETVYLLHSHSSPLEFYNGGCSSCRDDCMPDCPASPISYCDHILSFGSAKVYTYAPSLYPSNDTYGGNSLWTLFSDQTYFPSSWEHHFHYGTSLKDVLVYSDFTINVKDISGNVVDVLDNNNYDDFKDDVIDKNADYVTNENYYNNVVDQSFLDKILSFIKNFFKNLSDTFKDLFRAIFIPQDRIL